MKKETMSLQSRLTLLLLGAVMLFGIIAGYESYRNALHEADELFDAQLAQFAQSLLSVATDLDDDRAAPLPPPAHKYQQDFVFEIWDTEEEPARVLLRSNSEFSLPAHQLPEEKFSSGEWNGKHWRFYRQHDEERDIDVLVGQSDMVREELAREVALHNVTPFLFGLPVLALFAILAIRFGLSPLRRLTESLRQLSPEQLTTVTPGDTPREITPVVEALNSLLVRTAGVLENERRFTADAAHELRTPLAALQAQLQAAQLSTSDIERNECLAKSLQGTERMSHLVGQLLTLSRLDELTAPALLDQVDLVEVARSCSAELAPDALAKNIALELRADTPIKISASEELLRIMLRNLLDNAIRYTPQGGHVTIALKGETLTITDSGVGVDADKLPLLGKRFSRLDPSGPEGVGLGLSIVMRIAALHHANAEFRQAAGHSGLAVSVHFPNT
jgi:two-component system sensor histidine kinase QseC